MHSEGIWTKATRRAQHVQGRYNLLDYSAEDGKGYGKYAHIVGNGTSDTDRSNAHTLDWEGNAWFAGNIYIGGTGQDDENAKNIIQAVIEALPVYNGEVEEV